MYVANPEAVHYEKTFFWPGDGFFWHFYPGFGGGGQVEKLRQGQHLRGDSPIFSISRTFCPRPPPPLTNFWGDYVALYLHRHPERVRFDEN